jgi:hypothetical protein
VEPQQLILYLLHFPSEPVAPLAAAAAVVVPFAAVSF